CRAREGRCSWRSSNGRSEKRSPRARSIPCESALPRNIRLRSRERAMATFVLVHGAWHGSWCWKRVRRALQLGGHDVFTPTLTGVGERSHLLSRQVNLETHIDDVTN